MAGFHMTEDGPKICKAKSKATCPLKDASDNPVEHFANLAQAIQAYDNANRDLSHAKLKKEDNKVLNKLLANRGMYPEHIMRELALLMKFEDKTPLAVIPSGSALYNSQIPGKPFHDYDFIVITEPFESKFKMEPRIEGDLDATFVDIRKLGEQMERSTAVSEAFMGMKYGRSLATFDSPYSEYLKNFNISEQKYFDLLTDASNSQRENYTEPVSMDDKEGVRNFKHAIRWNIYQQRWATGKPMDPRLTDEERELFLKTLYSGRMSTLFES